MRKFTLSKKFERFEYDFLEERVGEKLPEELFEILEKYAGAGIEENIFFDKGINLFWTLTEFCEFGDINDYLEQIDEELSIAKIELKLFPFAGENSGWLFCISTEDSYPVYIFKTTDYAGNEAIQKIAPSFIEFINDLKCSDELS